MKVGDLVTNNWGDYAIVVDIKPSSLYNHQSLELNFITPEPDTWVKLSFMWKSLGEPTPVLLELL